MTARRARARKVTFTLDEGVAAAIDAAVAGGIARSKSGLVGEAVAEYLSRVEREQRRKEWRDAGNDPLFMADNDAVTRDFAATDHEAWSDLDGDGSRGR